MIRIMLNCGVSPEDLWPTEADRNLYSHFPRSQHHDSAWIIAFEGFVDELVLGRVLTQEHVIPFNRALGFDLTLLQEIRCTFCSRTFGGRHQVQYRRRVSHTRNSCRRAKDRCFIIAHRASQIYRFTAGMHSAGHPSVPTGYTVTDAELRGDHPPYRID